MGRALHSGVRVLAQELAQDRVWSRLSHLDFVWLTRAGLLFPATLSLRRADASSWALITGCLTF